MLSAWCRSALHCATRRASWLVGHEPYCVHLAIDIWKLLHVHSGTLGIHTLALLTYSLSYVLGFRPSAGTHQWQELLKGHIPEVLQRRLVHPFHAEPDFCGN
jgi:hypothetical protein